MATGYSNSDLDYTSTSALGFNGGMIQDNVDNNTIFSLPAPGGADSLGANKAIVIDAVPIVNPVVDMPAPTFTPTKMATPTPTSSLHLSQAHL